ncbi:Transcription factor TFIIIB component B'' [Cyberlindnera fabianii]|uniref:Transcription factor TFIIIB component B n=1 Tax=Cyberlindnera fabianii TaxID=36022 RepID=A0A1V2L4V7_CYBFA|nr:Transcription factor TFIIIB component B'' [Cyberlindnera fabianii]
MSSIVNKSGVRFTPKVKQRRANTGATNTPIASRRGSVAPPVDPLTPAATQQQQSQEEEEEQDDTFHQSSDVENDSDTQLPDSTDDKFASRLQTRRESVSGSVAASRRGSVVEPTPAATKQRRLSTLSNTSRGDVLRKPSFSSETRSHVISVPPPPAQLSQGKRRRRSSVASGPRAAVFRKRSSVGLENDESRSITATPQPITPITPASTQIQEEEQQQHHNESEPALTKSQAKAPEDNSVGRTIDAQNGDKHQEIRVKKLETDTETATPNGSIQAEGLMFDPIQGCLRKIIYDPSDPNSKSFVIKDVTTISTYNQLSKSLYSLDPQKLSNVTIDDETFTMKDLCRPTLPIGRVSSQYEKVQQAKKNRIEARKKRQDLRRQARLERRSLESLEDDKSDSKRVKPEDLLDDAQFNDQQITGHSAIQLKLGQDGQLVVDEESRVVDRHKNAGNIVRERYDENPYENIVNSATYGRQRYTDKWDKQEISKFYQALGQWGTDFALIAQMFPYRTRRQIKSKFILEEKKRPLLIELALSNKLKTQFDFDEYCNDANKTFGTLDEFNTKLEQLKADHEANLKELAAAKEKAKEEDTQRQKKREFEIQTGQRTMTRQERITELTKNETVLGSIDDVKKKRLDEAQAEQED